jgi:hypothetical protein
VLKDLPPIGHFGAGSNVSTPGQTPSPTLEGEKFFEANYLEGESKKERRRKRKKAEVFVSLFVLRA